MTWIEVADSATKIGLGALIAGALSLIALRMSHRNERNKDLWAHRIKTIEKVANHADQYFNAHAGVVSKIAWIVESNGGHRIPITDDMEQSVRKYDQDLLSTANGIRVAISSLNLLGATACTKDLKQAADLAMAFRDAYASSREFPSSAEIKAHLQQIGPLKEKVHAGLHAIYQSR